MGGDYKTINGKMFALGFPYKGDKFEVHLDGLHSYFILTKKEKDEWVKKLGDNLIVVPDYTEEDLRFTPNEVQKELWEIVTDLVFYRCHKCGWSLKRCISIGCDNIVKGEKEYIKIVHRLIKTMDRKDAVNEAIKKVWGK